MSAKQAVKEFWNQKACGEVYAEGDNLRSQLAVESRTRYQLEPYIHSFARFNEGQDKDVLEIGVGMGSDHMEWAKAKPRSLTGVDLTPRAIEFTKQRLRLNNLYSRLMVADAECLPFNDNSFDLIYSWGVLHHSPDTQAAINEVLRVLKPSGTARIMIYHKPSIVASLLWLRYGLLKGNPSLTYDEVFDRFIESPGTKAFTVEQGKFLCSGFSSVSVRSMLSFGDLLQGAVGQRYKSKSLSLVKALWPRWAIKAFFPHCGTMLLIEARK